MVGEERMEEKFQLTRRGGLIFSFPLVAAAMFFKAGEFSVNRSFGGLLVDSKAT